jgi:hypothetical protein
MPRTSSDLSSSPASLSSSSDFEIGSSRLSGYYCVENKDQLQREAEL